MKFYTSHQIALHSAIADAGYAKSDFSFTKKTGQKSLEESAQKCFKNMKTVVNVNRKDIVRILNHVPGCLHLHSKKLLYINMKRYYNKIKKSLSEVLPETFLVCHSL